MSRLAGLLHRFIQQLALWLRCSLGSQFNHQMMWLVYSDSRHRGLGRRAESRRKLCNLWRAWEGLPRGGHSWCAMGEDGLARKAALNGEFGHPEWRPRGMREEARDVGGAQQALGSRHTLSPGPLPGRCLNP